MIDTTYVVTMAAYNRWQNDNLYGAADALSEAERTLDRGAFFGSIQGTLNHILWADEVWLGRFSGRPHPATPIHRSHDRYQDWNELRAARIGLDADIAAWAEALDPAWLAQAPARSGASKTKPPRPHAFLVVHMFNHQTHHRGQVHAMLTAAGARPSDTDLLKMEP
ncbi:DinB family protein [Pendulispora rubella]|uniref:DinB family protein n=1 Tax=Pendulispora rubella TaxID=2741070 RepID=A0ABZ2L605_9BACT